jgi:hypothetical protein
MVLSYKRQPTELVEFVKEGLIRKESARTQWQREEE